MPPGERPGRAIPGRASPRVPAKQLSLGSGARLGRRRDGGIGRWDAAACAMAESASSAAAPAAPRRAACARIAVRGSGSLHPACNHPAGGRPDAIGVSALSAQPGRRSLGVLPPAASEPSCRQGPRRRNWRFRRRRTASREAVRRRHAGVSHDHRLLDGLLVFRACCHGVSRQRPRWMPRTLARHFREMSERGPRGTAWYCRDGRIAHAHHERCARKAGCGREKLASGTEQSCCA